AVTETYVPLIKFLDRLRAEGAPFKLTLSVSPPLANMMEDPLLRERCVRHFDTLVELAEREIERTRQWHDVNFLATMYRNIFEDSRRTFVERCQTRLVSAFRVASGGDVGSGVRLLSRPRRASGRGGGALLRGRLARGRARRPTAAVRDQRPAVLPLRGGRLRAASDDVQAGLEQQGRLPGRLQLPRVLPRHRPRARPALPRTLPVCAGGPDAGGDQVLPDHRAGAGQALVQPGPGPGHRRAPRAGLRGPLPRSGRARQLADAGPRGARLALRRGAVRPLVVRGPAVDLLY